MKKRKSKSNWRLLKMSILIGAVINLLNISCSKDYLIKPDEAENLIETETNLKIANNSDGILDLYALKLHDPNTSATSIEVAILDGARSFNEYLSIKSSVQAKLPNDPKDWDFMAGDYNSDAIPDIYMIKKNGASSTEVHILNGANNFKSYLLNTATALHKTGYNDSWDFELGDYNNDGKLDIYVIKKEGPSKTEVHVLNGANNFSTFLTHIATGLHRTGNDSSWDFEVGDFNSDGKLDLYVIKKEGASNSTEVHVLDGANYFQNFLMHTATVLHKTGTHNAWDFELGDYNKDGKLDIYAVNKQGSSYTDLHVLNGANYFQSYLANTSTSYPKAGYDHNYDFELAHYNVEGVIGEPASGGILVPRAGGLQWSDITESYELAGGSSEYQLIVEVDMAKLKDTKAHKSDPYWFKYFRSFWDDNGQYIPDKISSTYTTNCTSSDCGQMNNWDEWYSKLKFVSFNKTGGSNYFNNKAQFWDQDYFLHRTCVESRYKTGGGTASWHFENHFHRKIDDLYPGWSSLGPNYYKKNEIGVTYNFKMWLNDKVVLRPESSTRYEAAYWRTVNAGEVTKDGYAIIPYTDEKQGAYPNPDFQWIFVIPKGKSVQVSQCWPGAVGCTHLVQQGGPTYVYDPPLWTASDAEKIRRLIEEGSGLGLGDKITSIDISKEGWYQVIKENGQWKYFWISRDEAVAKAAQWKDVFVNGSGNNFDSGLKNAVAVANELGTTHIVWYYMPQEGSPSAYATASNTKARQALSFLQDYAGRNQKQVNVYTHSWGGYVATTEFAKHQPLDYINHVSVNPATLPSAWGTTMNASYGSTRTTTSVVYSTRDALSTGTYTYTRTGINGNSKVNVTSVSSGHGLIQTLSKFNLNLYRK